MSMENLTPITREEKIISGEDLQPITRMEYFLKKYGGGTGGGGGGSSVLLDTTLTKSGYAADAKAVGDRLAAIGNGGGGSYLLELTAESGELTDEQYNAVVANAPNVILLYDVYRIPLISVYDGVEFDFAASLIGYDGLVGAAQGHIWADKSYVFSMLESEFATKTYVNNAVATAVGGGIIDVAELPTVGNEGVLYRVPVAYAYIGKDKLPTKVYVVNGLPQTGEDVTANFQTVDATYYNIADGVEYGYVSTEVGAAAGMPAGWYPVAQLYGAFGSPYGGVVTTESEMTDYDTMYLLLDYKLYYFKGRWHCTTREVVEIYYLVDAEQFVPLADEVFEKIQNDYQNIDIHFYPSIDHSFSHEVMHLSYHSREDFRFCNISDNGSGSGQVYVEFNGLYINTTEKTISWSRGSSTFNS